ncbi:MAG: hypothetical protein GY784_07015 [Gammaproteobacteria bacterium]|nr:hypothetical protein [Gammaproteobacteria bacterium]
MKKIKQKVYLLSILLSVGLIALLTYQWVHEAFDREKVAFQLHNPEIVKRKIKLYEGVVKIDLITIPTGIFIESLFFENPVVFNVTGIIWQKWGPNLPVSLEPGFVLTEKIETADHYTEQLIYERDLEGGAKLFGWYFEAHIRQFMNYTEFPFDHKQVELRLQPKQFQSNVVLVPDFDSYLTSDLLTDSFGIDERIILDGYELTDTYFDFLEQSYDTNFGFSDYIGTDHFPELSFNIHLQRSMQNAFVIYLFPIIIVLLLLFGTMLTVTSDGEKRERMDSSMNMIIASGSALFFILVLSHVELRDRFITSPIVYIEYFYLLSYGAIFYVAANSYMFSEVKSGTIASMLAYEDNLIAKAAFWPLLLLISNIFTYKIIFD